MTRHDFLKKKYYIITLNDRYLFFESRFIYLISAREEPANINN